MKKIFTLFSSCLILAVHYAKAQSYVFFNDMPRLEIGASVNYIVYQGDLTSKKLGDYGKGSPGIGLHAGFDVTPSFAVKACLMFGMLSHDESKESDWRAERNFKFNSPVTSLDLSFRWFVLGKSAYSDPIWGRFRLNPYLIAGTGLVFFSPDSKSDNLNLSFFPYEDKLTGGLASDAMENYSKKSWFLSAGLGVRADVSPQMRVFLESTWRRTFTDYLDGFHYSTGRGDDSYSNIALGFSFKMLTRSVNKWTCPSSMELLVR